VLGEAWISREDDVDHVGALIEPIWVFLTIILIFHVWFLLGHFRQWSTKDIPDEGALKHQVVALLVDWASFVV
jgi:hypothetical protein